MLWVFDLRRGTRSRLTLDSEGWNLYPMWSRDGSRILFGSNRGGDWDIYSVSANGGTAKRLLARKGTQFPLSEAPDGTLLFSERGQGKVADLWMLSPSGTAAPYLVSTASKVGGQYSPDGRSVAYVSDESGRDEVYVRSVAQPDEVVAVSGDGGREPNWAPDGKELFYRRGDAFLAVKVEMAGKLSVGEEKKLFEIRNAAWGQSANHAGYAVSPDGKRFLVQRLDAKAIPTQINVVLNWFDELKSTVGPR
jgi:Tol biopolymer transport system component